MFGGEKPGDNPDHGSAAVGVGGGCGVRVDKRSFLRWLHFGVLLFSGGEIFLAGAFYPVCWLWRIINHQKQVQACFFVDTARKYDIFV
jgi:hypothetical protein